jgi:16S rRNA (guanine1207-N2)-methyltransferase
MNDHYYSSNPRTDSDRREIRAELRGTLFTFLTDSGVFSKKGVDFGSRLLIETAEIGEGSRILDLGCGYGPVGISLAKTVSGVHAILADINERAVGLAALNARLNGVEDRVQGVVSDGLEQVRDFTFDHILLNPPIRAGKSVVYRLFAEAGRALREEGSLWIVIRKEQGAASALKELQNLFAEVEVMCKKKGYWILRARHR